MNKTLLQEVKAMNKIAGTQMTKEQEITLIKERLKELNESAAAVAAARNARMRRHAAKANAEKREKEGPSRKSWYNDKITNPETGRQILVKTALGYDKKSPVYLAAIKKSKDHGPELNYVYNAHFTPKGTLRQKGKIKNSPQALAGKEKWEKDPLNPKNKSTWEKMKNFFGVWDKKDPLNPNRTFKINTTPVHTDYDGKKTKWKDTERAKNWKKGTD